MPIFLYYLLLISELIILLCVSIYGMALVFSTLKGAPYVPTSKKQLARIFDVVKPKRGTFFIELGSGDGRIIRFAAKKYGVVGEGVEVNALLNFFARFFARRDKVDKQISFVSKNIFEYDCKKADYVYLFLMPQLIIKLLPFFKKQLRKNTIIISHGFKLPGWEKKMFHTLPDKAFSTYYYKM